MKKIIIVLTGIILFLAVVVFVVPELRKAFMGSFKKAHEDSFETSFKKSFVRACSAGNPSRVCECVADKALAQLAVTQLQNEEFAVQYLKQNLFPLCIEQYKRNVAHSNRVKGG